MIVQTGPVRLIPPMLSEVFQKQVSSLKQQIEAALSETVGRQPWPEALAEAVNYSLMAGGKRLRPGLVLLANDVCGGRTEEALPAACAIEMIHTYSLIHDDLPCMDDDDLRRGRPTSHRVFGEALATLAGDALLTLAFETLGAAPTPPQITADCLRILATAAGGSGMVGGQILDLEAERGPFRTNTTQEPANTGDGPDNSELTGNSGGNPRSIPQPATDSKQEAEPDSSNVASTRGAIHVEHLIQIHKMKTGALITAALELGATVASASAEQRSRLAQYGRCTGLAFQIADDLLDVTGTDERLGKETGRDNELGKLTYPSLMGIEASRSKAISLAEEARAALDIFDQRADSLRELARFIVERDH